LVDFSTTLVDFSCSLVQLLVDFATAKGAGIAPKLIFV